MGSPRWPVNILLSLDFPSCTYLCFSLQLFPLLLSHEITIKNLDMGDLVLLDIEGLEYYLLLYISMLIYTFFDVDGIYLTTYLLLHETKLILSSVKSFYLFPPRR